MASTQFVPVHQIGLPNVVSKVGNPTGNSVVEGLEVDVQESTPETRLNFLLAVSVHTYKPFPFARTVLFW